MGIWYSVGTATVTANSKVVTFAGGAQVVSNGNPGDVLAVVGYPGVEIETFNSATQVTLAKPWPYAGGGGLAYSIQPTTAVAVLIASRAFAALTAMEIVRDTIGQGLVGSGSATTPSIRFIDDQDTGLRRGGENTISLVTGGVDAFTVIGGYRAFIGTQASPIVSSAYDANSYNGETARLTLVAGSGSGTHSLIRYTHSGSAELVAGGVQQVDGSLDYVVQGFNLSSYREYFRIDASANGSVGIGTPSPSSRLHVTSPAATQVTIENTSGTGDCATVLKVPGKQWNIGINVGGVGNGVLTFYDVSRGIAPVLVDSGGNLLVGVTSGTSHTFDKPGGQGTLAFRVRSTQLGTSPLSVYAVNTDGFNTGQGAAVAVGTNTVTGRSIITGGTINASGADLAEYWLKADACGIILKGQVCGVDVRGDLTDRWSQARSFGAKATLPGLVMGDSYAKHLGDRPMKPDEPEEPSAEHDAAVAAWSAADAAWVEAEAAARARVDRIAFTGRIPIDIKVTAADAGAYIVAAEGPDDTIVPRIVPVSEIAAVAPWKVGRILCPMTGNLAAEIKSVWKRPATGRAWVDVQRS